MKMNHLPAQKNKAKTNPVLSAVEWAIFYLHTKKLAKC